MRGKGCLFFVRWFRLTRENKQNLFEGKKIPQLQCYVFPLSNAILMLSTFMTKNLRIKKKNLRGDLVIDLFMSFKRFKIQLKSSDIARFYTLFTLRGLS